MLALGASLGWDVIVFEGIMATGVSCNSSCFLDHQIARIAELDEGAALSRD